MTQAKQNKFFYGWVIVGIALLSLIVSNGLAILGIPVFYKSVQTDLVNAGIVGPDKIQSVYGLAPALTSLLAGLLSPVGGFLLQKFNARRMMLIGCALLGSGLIVYSQANSLLAVYLAHALMGASLGFVGVLVSTVLISNWFQKNRGLALGIVLTGTSFGGVLIPQLASPLIQNYGWRAAMILTSLIIWVILLPAVIFLVKNRPADLGLWPDGEPGEEQEIVDSKQEIGDSNQKSEIKSKSDDENRQSQIETLEFKIEKEQSPIANRQSPISLSLDEALGSPRFWIFSFCAALIFYAIFAVSQQLNLYLQGPKMNFTAPQASGVQSLIFALSVLGKFLFGWLADRFPANRVMIFSAATMFLATLLFLIFNSQTVYLFAVFFGLNYGGTFVLLQLLVVEYFGLKEYGKILGAVTVIETIGGGLGTIISGKIADANGGDYTRAFDGVIVVAGLALLTVIFLNLSAGRWQRPVRLLPIFLTPLVGALIGVIAGPVFTEIFRVVAGVDFSLLIPLIIIFSLIGLILGIRSGRNIKECEQKYRN